MTKYKLTNTSQTLMWIEAFRKESSKPNLIHSTRFQGVPPWTGHCGGGMRTLNKIDKVTVPVEVMAH
jgi:hypothetical protein